MTFQMTFAIITPALIVGAFAERMKFSAMLWFMGVWVIFVYAPDRAIGSGAAAGSVTRACSISPAARWCTSMQASPDWWLQSCWANEMGSGSRRWRPNNLGYTVIGAAMLWVGWFGFNAGSQLAADGGAGMAMAVTQIATAAAALSWMFCEWTVHGKPSVLGIAQRRGRGLGGDYAGSRVRGSDGRHRDRYRVRRIGCYVASTKLKNALGYDDSLDVFGVHCGRRHRRCVADGNLRRAGTRWKPGDHEYRRSSRQSIDRCHCHSDLQRHSQLRDPQGPGCDIGLRVSEDVESEGLDLTLHDERGYNI